MLKDNQKIEIPGRKPIGKIKSTYGDIWIVQYDFDLNLYCPAAIDFVTNVDTLIEELIDRRDAAKAEGYTELFISEEIEMGVYGSKDRPFHVIKGVREKHPLEYEVETINKETRERNIIEKEKKELERLMRKYKHVEN